MNNKLFTKPTGFGQIIDGTVARSPEREAIVYKGWRITYGEMGKLINQTAHYLRSLGLAKGSRLSVISRNCPECLLIEIAALKLGIIPVRINWRLSPEEMEYIIDLNDVNMVFYRPENPEWGKALSEHYSDAAHAGKIFVNLNDTDKKSVLYDLVTDFPDDSIEIELSPDDEAVRMHTSGTTGRPKCVVYTHGGMLGELESVKDIYEYTDGQRYQFIAQLFHTACIGAYLSLCTGGTLVLMDRFDPATYMQSLISERITAISVVPTVLKWILDEADKHGYDLSELRVVRYSTCPIPPATLHRAMEKLHCNFYQSYGMTEMGSIVTALVSEDHFTDNGAHLDSVGRPIPGAQMMIADENDNECPAGVVGEILVKGPGKMKCYLGQPELTKNVFRGGWYHTHDMGFIDEYGYLHISGRSDDMIISGGENIHPAEITNVIMAMPGVKEAAVYGLPDDTWGERVKASVVLYPDVSITSEQIRAFCKQKIAGFKVPKEVEILSELPKTPSGKVIIRELKERSMKK